MVTAVILVSWAFYYFHHVRTRQEILFSHEINMVNLQKAFARHLLKSVTADLGIIAEDLSEHLSDMNTFENTGGIQKNFLSFSKYKGIYDQVRILDTSGMERIRVDLRDEKPQLVPRSKLQFKGNRYYFIDTMKLEKGEIYMSPFDLNVENGEIERPFKPMIRFGQILWDHTGKKIGVILLNYLGSNLIRELEKLSYQSPGRLMIANAQGYWLKATNPEDEWGFMIPERKDKTLQNAYPKLWQTISEQNSGQVTSAHGLFTFQKIYLLEKSIRSSSGTATPQRQSRCMLAAEDCYWIILSHIPTELLKKGNIDFVNALIAGDMIFLTLLGIMTWRLIKSNLRRKLAEEALRKSHQNLEETVQQRTMELQESNLALTHEMEAHKEAIKKRRKVESQLQQAQKMEAIGTLSGGIAHDFNNLLMPILGYSEMIKMELAPNHSVSKDVDEIIKAAGRAKELVQQILTFSRQGEQELKLLKAQLVVKEALKLLRSSIPTTIAIKKNIQMDCPMVQADPIHIHQIVMNLCTNAYHAMKETGGVLTVALAVKMFEEGTENEFALPSGEYLELKICDTGPGISKTHLNKIFEPYFTTKQQGEGTGLGLAVVHSIVRNMNGAIFVESELNKGSCFLVYLPTTEASETSAGKTETEQIYSTGTEKVLLVDDDPSVLKVEYRILKELGYQVTAKSSSRKALEIFTVNPGKFDLIVTDMTMPGMTGLALLQNILDQKPDMKTVLLTGYSDNIRVEDIRQLGVNSVFSKPILLSHFARAIRRILDEDTGIRKNNTG